MENSVGNLLGFVRHQFHVEDFRDAAPNDCCGDSSAMSEMFERRFLQTDKRDSDDMLFYVRTDSKVKDGVVDVLRRDSQMLPKWSDSTVLWDQTLYLNVLMHEFEYELTCGVIGVPEADEKLRVLKQVSTKVYPSSSEQRMDKKGKRSDAIFPDLIFTIDNFEEIFSGLNLNNPGEKIAVQIVATNAAQSIRKLVFIGGLEYSVIKTACLSKQKDKQLSRIKRLSMRRKHGYCDFKQQLQFVRMRGPHMKGYAEMGFDLTENLPESENGDHSDLEGSCRLDSPSQERSFPAVSSDLNQELAATSPIDIPSEFNTNGHSATRSTPPPNPLFAACNDEFAGNFDAKVYRKSSDPMHSVNLIPTKNRVEKSALLLRLQAAQEQGDLPMPPSAKEVGLNGASSLSKDVDWEEDEDRGPGRRHSDGQQQYEALNGTNGKLKRENSVRRLVNRFSFRSGKNGKTKHPSSYVISSYLTFIRLPWYLIMDDILNGTRLPLL